MGSLMLLGWGFPRGAHGRESRFEVQPPRQEPLGPCKEAAQPRRGRQPVLGRGTSVTSAFLCPPDQCRGRQLLLPPPPGSSPSCRGRLGKV